jgi:hypothetical protein
MASAPNWRVADISAREAYQAAIESIFKQNGQVPERQLMAATKNEKQSCFLRNISDPILFPFSAVIGKQ